MRKVDPMELVQLKLTITNYLDKIRLRLDELLPDIDYLGELDFCTVEHIDENGNKELIESCDPKERKDIESKLNRTKKFESAKDAWKEAQDLLVHEFTSNKYISEP
jgi:hypothetical protein